MAAEFNIHSFRNHYSHVRNSHEFYAIRILVSERESFLKQKTRGLNSRG